MPAATSTQAKTEREERLLQALKTHILKERQRKKEEHEAEVEEERQRKEREARERQDVMTLGETREQILKLDQKLKELKNQKQQLFLQLKKVLNEDESRKKQQQQKDRHDVFCSEILSMHNIPPQNTAPHGQIFLPPRQSHQQILQKGGPGSISNPPIKRGRSPSPPPASGYFKSAAYSPPKHEDNRRNSEVPRVLWTKPQQYQTPPGTLFYQTTTPSTQPDSRAAAAQSIMYPSYNPNLNIPPPIRQNYHIEIPQPPPSNPQSHSQKADQQQKSAQVYHINLDLPLIPPPQAGPPPSSGPNPSVMSSQHKSQVTLEKVQDRSGYHVEVKLDPSQQQIVHTSLLPGIPLHPTVMQIPTNPNQSSKTGGSITQGYSNRNSGHNQPPPPMSGQPPPPPQSQIHYQRRLF